MVVRNAKCNISYKQQLRYKKSMLFKFNQSINQSWIYIAHTRKASNALVR